jgi:hypothetical protein
MKQNGCWKTFRGPNGWYVAWENAAGFHYQPANGGEYATKQEAINCDGWKMQPPPNTNDDN